MAVVAHHHRLRQVEVAQPRSAGSTFAAAQRTIRFTTDSRASPTASVLPQQRRTRARPASPAT
jgi:hypothetical protein